MILTQILPGYDKVLHIHSQTLMFEKPEQARHPVSVVTIP